ncbi:MAG: fumarate hydratase, partial [Actinobacteria bacterium]|nr:fumarate hydratase [Actinomycetota bacterium]
MAEEHPPEFEYTDLLPLLSDPYEITEFKHLGNSGVSTLEGPDGRNFLKVEQEAIQLLTSTAMRDIAHLFRSSHLSQLAEILKDPEASENDRFVALELLHNANISAGGVLPSCQDTGTALIIAKKGQQVLTDIDDKKVISQGVYDTYTTSNLRYSQLAPLDMFTERNTGTNLPAQIEIEAVPGDSYKFLFLAKGGGSANKSFLFQETRALLEPDRLISFLDEKLRTLGTAACPPYHLSVVIGGTSAEFNLKVAKYASARYLDHLPTEGSESGHGFRDLEWEQKILDLTREFGIGAQFGGKYFCHDVRVIRLPRHAASNPVGVAVSCSADRQALGKITSEGIFLEQLEEDPARFLPETLEDELSGDVVPIDLNRPMKEIRSELSKYPVKTRLALTGTLVVARDVAHAAIAKRLDSGEPMPEYLIDHPVYYAGPAKTPEGYASGSFGPTTAGRMDTYVEKFQSK